MDSSLLDHRGRPQNSGVYFLGEETTKIAPFATNSVNKGKKKKKTTPHPKEKGVLKDFRR